MKRLSFTKEMTEIKVFRFFNLFSKMWKTSNKYKANKIGDSIEPCLISILTSKKGEEKSF